MRPRAEIDPHSAHAKLGPDSISWRINREAVLLLGGGRALLMQIAHPLVAAGVAAHSNFKQAPIERLRQTIEALHALNFGNMLEAQAAYRKIDSIHARVRGRLAQPAAGFATGARYNARDPELLLWVLATLIDTSILFYRRYVGYLSPADEERYYQQSKRIARLFKIPASLIPAELQDFRRYMEQMIDGPVRVSGTGRELARAILYPQIGFIPPRMFEPLNLVTVGRLPPRLREDFGFEWSAARELLLDASSVAIRAMLPLIPDFLRAVPAARVAERVIRSEPSSLDGQTRSRNNGGLK